MMVDRKIYVLIPRTAEGPDNHGGYTELLFAILRVSFENTVIATNPHESRILIGSCSRLYLWLCDF